MKQNSAAEEKRWLKQAENDLDDAKFNLKGKRFHLACFLAQQSAEKALKALFISRFNRLWRTHDLVGLATKIDASQDILKICDKLNPHYIETRYPVEVEYTEEVAKEAVEIAKKVIEWAKKRIRQES